jgi:hypothetical protein
VVVAAGLRRGDEWDQATFGGGNFDFNSVGGGMSNGVVSLGNLAGLEMLPKTSHIPLSTSYCHTIYNACESFS